MLRCCRHASPLLVGMLVLKVAIVNAASATEPSPPNEVDLLWAVKIPLRDGVRLNATVYKPAETKGPLPAIFTLTPYIADSYHDRAMYFAQHDYLLRIQSVQLFQPSVGQGQPTALACAFAQLNLPGKELQQRWRGIEGVKQRCAHGARHVVPRRRAPELLGSATNSTGEAITIG